MKNLVLTLTCFTFLSTASFATVAGIEAPGAVMYKMPSGKLVKRNLSLFVPEKGQGDVILKYGNGKEVKSQHFKTTKAMGRTTFTVVFKDAPGAPAGTSAVFTGSYLRGSNGAAYYGDVFGAKGTDGVEDWDLWLDENVKQGQAKYAGGFYFYKKIP